MLLTDMGVLPLQVFWWRQTLRFCNDIAALPVGSFFHTVLLDSCYDAFHHDAFNFTSSVAACSHRDGVSMPRDTDRVPMLDISAVIDALKADLQGLCPSTLSCPRQAPTCGLVRCTYDHWFQPVSACRRYCQLPVAGKNMKRFLRFRLGFHKLQLLLVLVLVLLGFAGCAYFVMLGLWGRNIWCLSVLNWHQYGPNMLICSTTRVTPCVLFLRNGTI